MPALAIYSKQESARLRYVLNWLFKERLGIDYTLVNQKPSGSEVYISYGFASDDSISIPDVGLLWKTSIQEQNIVTGTWENLPTLYSVANGYNIPFDIFSAIFFLLSRYEEYYNYSPDKHNRYPATESILFKNDLLKRPIVDEWVSAFSNTLISKNIAVKKQVFQFLPTYDIDIAWSYKHKGVKRSIGALAKDILKGRFDNAQKRVHNLSGSGKDPYDSFEWLDQLHEQNNLEPIYFILYAQNTSDFDKNITPSNPAMRALVQHLSNKYKLGMHPSYYTDKKKNLLAEEKQNLEGTIDKTINISRQHYIKNKIPNTYQQLLATNITDDYSMGYGTHLGFRAGTGNSFLWFDLEKEQTQNLRVHPFCFMDTTAHYEEKLSTKEAFDILRKMKMRLEQAESRMVTVFHNFSLGSGKEWNGWKGAYERFISEYKL